MKAHPEDDEASSVTSRSEPTRTCAAPGCDQVLAESTTGRQARYCSPACRVRAHRQRNAARVLVEVDHGSASSRGRPPDRAFMVRLRRGERSVIVAIGLRRSAAEHLAGQLSDLLGPMPPQP
ncbi:MAG: CGNR zinc finger domain-containing protein [Acidimicrobiales bacterium]